MFRRVSVVPDQPSQNSLVNFDPLEQVRQAKTLVVTSPPDGFVPGFKATVHTRPVDPESRDPLQPRSQLIEDISMEFEQEDSLFSGTNGELALRLIAALTLTKTKDNDDKKIRTLATHVFFGYKVWASSVTRQFYQETFAGYNGRPRKKKVEIGELWDTTPADYVLTNLTEDSKNRLKFMDRTVTVEYGSDGNRIFKSGRKDTVFVSGDASFVFISTGEAVVDKIIYERLSSALQIPKAVIPIIAVENSAPVIRQLVELSPLKSLGIPFDIQENSESFKLMQQCEASIVPYLDLKFGAWPPWLKMPVEISGSSRSIGVPEQVIAKAVCPAFFTAGICNSLWDESSVLGRFRKASSALALETYPSNCDMVVHTALSPPPEGTVVFARYGSNIAIGYLDRLVRSLTDIMLTLPDQRDLQNLPSKVTWTRLTSKRLYHLFGPPLHLFVPEKLAFGVWVDIPSAIRLFPEAPKLQLPARLNEGTPEEQKKAKEILNALAPGGWMSNDSSVPGFQQQQDQVVVTRSNTSGNFSNRNRNYRNRW